MSLENRTGRRAPSAIEKFVAILSYINPLIGFIVIIISAIMKKDMRPFLKYHVFQSIFLAFTLWIIASGLTLLMNIVSYIPIVKNIVSMITFFLNTPIIAHLSVIQCGYLLLVIYLIIGVLRNSDSFVPWVSNIIKSNLRGQI